MFVDLSWVEGSGVQGVLPATPPAAATLAGALGHLDLGTAKGPTRMLDAHTRMLSRTTSTTCHVGKLLFRAD